jgi:hypothetical protein
LRIAASCDSPFQLDLFIAPDDPASVAVVEQFDLIAVGKAALNWSRVSWVIAMELYSPASGVRREEAARDERGKLRATEPLKQLFGVRLAEDVIGPRR